MIFVTKTSVNTAETQKLLTQLLILLTLPYLRQKHSEKVSTAIETIETSEFHGSFSGWTRTISAIPANKNEQLP
jgi:hypothetical protein